MTHGIKRHCSILTGLVLALIISLPSLAHAQKTEYPRWSFTGDEKVRTLVEKALADEFAEFKKEFLTIPMFQTALADLNGDGKPEIFARFSEEYYFRDSKDNTKTYVFAYTSKGIINILDVMAGDLAIGAKDKSGLRQIIAFNGLTPQYTVYAWDGKRRYVKQ